MGRRRASGGALVGALSGTLALAPSLGFAASASLQLEQPGGAPLADAVFLAFSLDSHSTSPPRPAVMDQHDRKFVPQILVVERGAKVSFSNSDTVSHHVYSFSPTRRFQLFLEKEALPPSLAFDRAGVATLGCNLHDWMLGYIVVVETPYFGKTDATGKVTLGSLAAGRYRLEVWHPRATDPEAGLRRELELTGDGAELWKLRLARPLLPSREQKPAFRDYRGGQ